MENRFLCHPKCGTCAKARAWLNARDIPFTEQDIRDPNPTVAELHDWAARSGLPMRKLFNTSGIQYRANNLSTRLPLLTDTEQLTLLGTDGMLVKRPVMIAANGRVLFGFREVEWEAAFSGE